MCPVVLYALRTKCRRAAGVGAAGHLGAMAGGRAGKRPGAAALAGSTGPLSSYFFDASFLLYIWATHFSLERSSDVSSEQSVHL